MPLGTVCQLHYQGGGIVQFRETSGSWVRLPFLHAPFLRIGQEVRFTVSSAGEALGVEVLQPGADEESSALQHLKQKAEREQKQLVPSKRHAEEALGLQRPAWKLQRCIDRFQNADLEGRLDMLSRAEATLKQLLQEDEPDGNAICGLVCKVVGWLQAPRFSKQTTGCGGGSREAGGTGDLQCRIRRLLISALSSLDLTDEATEQAVETAVVYIRQLIQDVRLADLETSRAARQWRKLQSLISVEAESTLSIEDGPKRQLRTETLKRQDRASIVEGAFNPNIRVRQLPLVYAGDAVRLTCPSCPASITSRWWWRHPKTQEVYLLIPQHGCFHGNKATSRGKVDETSRWRPVNVWPTKNDDFTKLDFCCHQRKRCQCAECGGYSICSHGKRRSSCRLCRRPPKKK